MFLLKSVKLLDLNSALRVVLLSSILVLLVSIVFLEVHRKEHKI